MAAQVSPCASSTDLMAPKVTLSPTPAEPIQHIGPPATTWSAIRCVKLSWPERGSSKTRHSSGGNFGASAPRRDVSSPPGYCGRSATPLFGAGARQKPGRCKIYPPLESRTSPLPGDTTEDIVDAKGQQSVLGRRDTAPEDEQTSPRALKTRLLKPHLMHWAHRRQP